MDTKETKEVTETMPEKTTSSVVDKFKNIKKPDFSKIPLDKVKGAIQNIDKEWFVNNRKMLMLAAFVVVAIAMLVVSYLTQSVPIVVAGAFVILEALLCALLDHTPIWVHALVIAVQLVMGFYFDHAVFMVLMVIVYVVALLLLYVWTKDEA